MPYLADPEIWGPGVWFNIHLLAAKADDLESKELFISYINVIVRNLPCLECRKHATKYIEDNSLIGFLADTDSEGLFRWSWIFHNFVNTRLGKSFMDWDTAHDMFYNENGVCAGDCGSPLISGLSVYTKGGSSDTENTSQLIGVTYIDW